MASFRVPCWFIGLVTAAVALTAVVVLHVGTATKTEPLVVDDDGIRWELLESIADQVVERFAKMPDGVSQQYHHLYFLFGRYRCSTRPEKSQTVEEIRELLKEKAEVDMTLRMIELLLFGPIVGIEEEEEESEQPKVGGPHCFDSTLHLFEKHCHVRWVEGSSFTRTIIKICNKLGNKAGVEEAFKVACSSSNRN